MIKNDFEIDLAKKIIFHSPKGSEKVYSASELYSFLMDVFDEVEYMKYDIPIAAKSNTEFELINGWTIDKEGLAHIKGEIK